MHHTLPGVLPEGGVTLVHRAEVKILYKDGLHAVFTAKTADHNAWVIEGLKQFKLYDGDRLIAQYDSPLSDGIKPHFTELAPEYSEGHVLEYWDSAAIHTDQEYRGHQRFELNNDSKPELEIPAGIIAQGQPDRKRFQDAVSYLSDLIAS